MEIATTSFNSIIIDLLRPTISTTIRTTTSHGSISTSSPRVASLMHHHHLASLMLDGRSLEMEKVDLLQSNRVDLQEKIRNSIGELGFSVYLNRKNTQIVIIHLYLYHVTVDDI
jgi:hypothetical protein